MESARTMIVKFESMAWGQSATQPASPTQTRVLIRDCDGFDLYFLGNRGHGVSDSVIDSRAARAVVVDGSYCKKPGVCSLKFERVEIVRECGPQEIRVGTNALLECREVAVTGLNLTATGGEIRAQDSMFTGDPEPEFVLWPAVKWSGDRHRYDLKFIRQGSVFSTGKNFAEFQKATASESGSRWGL